MSDTDTERMTWPTYALRAWLGALVAHVRRSRHELEARIDAAEKEAARLRRHHERAGSVIESLEESIGRVDARLRQTRDTGPAGREYGAPHDPPPKEPDKDKARDAKPTDGAPESHSPTRGPSRAR
jgi:hypothetical protein